MRGEREERDRPVDPSEPASPHGLAGSVDLFWIPLGSGQRVVRLSGRLFEALSAAIRRRPRCDLYHTALIVRRASSDDHEHGTNDVVIEVAPADLRLGSDRGVVAGGSVGLQVAGRLRLFRYEVRRWSGGVLPDANDATAIDTVDLGPDGADRLVELVASVPTPVWGRDELRAGEMWNSNSVTSWLLTRAGADMSTLGPPAGGRAPGWDAGVVVAAR